MGINDGFDNGKSQSGTAFLPGWIDPIEPVEHVRQVLGGHARAGSARAGATDERMNTSASRPVLFVMTAIPPRVCVKTSIGSP